MELFRIDAEPCREDCTLTSKAASEAARGRIDDKLGRDDAV
jgi:hypothetical protein